MERKFHEINQLKFRCTKSIGNQPNNESTTSLIIENNDMHKIYHTTTVQSFQWKLHNSHQHNAFTEINIVQQHETVSVDF